MKIKKIVTISLAAAAVAASGSALASNMINEASACLSDAATRAESHIMDIQKLFAGNHNTFAFNAVEVDGVNGFTRGTSGSSHSFGRGVVYSKLGIKTAVGGGVAGQHLFVAYMGSGCGALKNTKLTCDVKVLDAGNVINVVNSNTDLDTINKESFHLDCHVCTGVMLADSTGLEEAATAHTRLNQSQLKTIGQAATSAVQAANKKGLDIDLSTSAWASTGICAHINFGDLS